MSALALAKSLPNVLVTRTFSKIYGLAGLRLGYGIGSTGPDRSPQAAHAWAIVDEHAGDPRS